MYIWILLATIMVALSFFNLSPRSDVDNTVNEVKAAAVINRFRAEHMAMVHTMECEVIKRHFGSSDILYPTNLPLYLNSKLKSANPLNYTKYQCNLPVGYDRSGSGLSVHHELACTSKNLENHDGDNAMKDCGHTKFRYAISYAPIPARWLAKKADDNDVVKPLPVLVDLMARSTSAGTVYGWTDCSGVGSNTECHLRGYSAKIGTLIDDEFSDGISSKTIKSVYYTEIDSKAPIWSKMTTFGTLCNQVTPCLFAYERLASVDKGHHCKMLMEAQNPTCTFLGDGISE